MTDHHPNSDAESAAAIWTGLRNHLAARFRELSGEIRHYPTPIARCDDQLPKLIEQRDHARRELERMSAVDGGSADSHAPSPREIERFLETANAVDDDTEAGLRVRLKAAVSAGKS